MARRPCTFRQTDVTRALRATTAAGVQVQRIEIDRKGKIVMIVGDADAPSKPRGNDWDEVLPDGQN